MTSAVDPQKRAGVWVPLLISMLVGSSSVGCDVEAAGPDAAPLPQEQQSGFTDFDVTHSIRITAHPSVPDIWQDATGAAWTGVSVIELTHLDEIGFALAEDDGRDDVACCVRVAALGNSIGEISDDVAVSTALLDQPEDVNRLINTGTAGFYIVPEIGPFACPQEELVNGTILGCYRVSDAGQPAMIVSVVANYGTWIHEFGHLVGLSHTANRMPPGIMDPPTVNGAVVQRNGVTEAQCRALRIDLSIFNHFDTTVRETVGGMCRQ